MEDFLSGGLGINDGLRHMSDLETPEADMMRDHSSLDAAPATLRLEESQPGPDPNNPSTFATALPIGLIPG